MKKLFKFISRAVLLYIGVSLLVTTARLLSLPTSTSCTEYSLQDSVSLDYTHQRRWDVYGERSNTCMTISTAKTDESNAYRQRNDLAYPRYERSHYEDYWQKVYQALSNMESRVLAQVQDSLTQTIIYEGMDHYEAADLIVSFVQDISYTLIKSDECEKDDVKPCIGNQKFGLLAPSEFLYELNGDCDTRAVLLYELLNRMGYETIIVVSREYGHAMIAIDLPLAGDFISYKGQQYYFWETTAKGWRAGMLPPSYPEIAYWKVALAPKRI